MGPSEGLPRAAPPPPKPAHVAAHTKRKHVSLSWWSPALALFPLAPVSPPPTFQPPPPTPHRALWEGSLPLLTVYSCLSASHTSGHRLGQPGLPKAEKWVETALIVPTCCQPRSPTGSRRRAADVREDKGRHGPHQPPIIDGLCQPRRSWREAFFSSNLRAPPSNPQPPAPGPAAPPGREGRAGDSQLSLNPFILFFKSRLL